MCAKSRVIVLCTFGISSLGSWSYFLADLAVDLSEVKRWSWGRAIYEGEHQSHKHRRGGDSDPECSALGVWILWVCSWVKGSNAESLAITYIIQNWLTCPHQWCFKPFVAFFSLYGRSSKCKWYQYQRLDECDCTMYGIQYPNILHEVLWYFLYPQVVYFLTSICSTCLSLSQEETVIKFLSKVKLFQRLPKELSSGKSKNPEGIWRRCFDVFF